MLNRFRKMHGLNRTLSGQRSKKYSESGRFRRSISSSGKYISFRSTSGFLSKAVSRSGEIRDRYYSYCGRLSHVKQVQ